jgi:hypothetical protein
MRAQLRSPLHGLLTGLVALIVFASFAVAMAAGGSSAGGAAQTSSAQAVANTANNGIDGARELSGNDSVGRFVRGGHDGGGRDGRSGDDGGTGR